MPAKNAFRDFVADQLAGLEEFRTRAMFGGHGLYSGATFFGLITSEGRLFFFTNPETERPFVERGMGCFEYAPGAVMGAYREVPLDVLETPTELLRWARTAVAARPVKPAPSARTAPATGRKRPSPTKKRAPRRP